MDDFFEGVASAHWPTQRRLHVYASPNDELRDVAATYQGARHATTGC